MAPEIEVRRFSGALPLPTGGVIADGIYDLVDIREYDHDTFANVYSRAALKFVGTSVEHIYDPNWDYATENDSPHRLLSVTADGATLRFQVDCPRVIFASYERGFSVQANELWLFQAGLIEVYTRRP